MDQQAQTGQMSPIDFLNSQVVEYVNAQKVMHAAHLDYQIATKRCLDILENTVKTCQNLFLQAAQAHAETAKSEKPKLELVK